MGDVDGEAPADQAVRRRALSADGSFIVQAPAGSGKTELLIQRYLNLLGRVREPEEIVAITFTRKAAGEMRERVVDALRRAAAGCTGSGEVEALRLDLARRAMDNDRRHGWELTHHPARLQIQTIDALCLSLTRQLPFLSGFSAPAGILDDVGAAYRRASVETLRLLGGSNEEWRDALRRFLIHTDNDISRAAALLEAMLASRDQWLRHIGEGAVSTGGLEGAWCEVIQAALGRVGACFPASLEASMLECADAAARQLEGSIGATAWHTDSGFPGAAAGDLPRWRFIADLLLKKNTPQFRKIVNRSDGFPPESPAKQPMMDLLAALSSGDPALADALHAVRWLPDPRLDGVETRTIEAMVTVLKLAAAQLQLIFDETGGVDFVEVNQRAITALGALENPSDLALKLDYQIQHLLVDEFQDTSIAQYQLLVLLTQGWAPDDGKTLFLVGDPMQSIYRFREAEVAVFLEVWERGLGTVSLEPLILRTNFRSAAGIVNWVNDTFGQCFPEVPEPGSGAVAYAESTPRDSTSDPEARVYVHSFLDHPESAQAARFAELVGEALGRSNEVAVLVRARAHLKEILPALQSRDIPFSGVDITALINEPVVRDLYSLTRALLHPGDRMAWLSLLRAPWCGLALEDLLTVAGSQRVLIWDALHDPAVRSTLSGDGLARIERLSRALQGAVRQRGRLAPRQWVRRAWVSLDGPAFVDEGGLGHARTYFELLGLHQAGMTVVDDRAFRKALQSHWAHAEARGGAVQLMTIHRAKGLEFDEVFLPALERPTARDEKRLLLWDESAERRSLLLATLSPRGTDDDPHYRFLRRLQARKSEYEDDRLLYVACTRARRRLHLLANLTTRDGSVTGPRSGSLLRHIWPAVAASFEAGDSDAGTAISKPEAASGAGQPLKRVSIDWQAPACPESLRPVAAAPIEEQRIEFSWAGETARQIGILVHELIQRIAADGREAWNENRVEAMEPSWRGRLAHIGVPPGELDAAARRTARAIRNLLEDDRVAWLLRRDHAEVENEYELSVVAGERVRRLRIDRTFVDEHGVRWIVDYKTSAHEGADLETFLNEEARRYRAQMEDYADAFVKAGAAEIRLGLYFPLLKGWREWAYS